MKTASPKERQRGFVETALLDFADENGLQVEEVTPRRMAASKGRSRGEDARRLAAGEATPDELQIKNDYFPGAVVVLDWSPALV